MRCSPRSGLGRRGRGRGVSCAGWRRSRRMRPGAEDDKCPDRGDRNPEPSWHGEDRPSAGWFRAGRFLRDRWEERKPTIPHPIEEYSRRSGMGLRFFLFADHRILRELVLIDVRVEVADLGATGFGIADAFRGVFLQQLARAARFAK